MGFGDLFVAALVGCLLAASAVGRKRPTRRGFRPTGRCSAAVLVAVLALGFDLLFFAVDSLPATVPVAVALAIVQRLSVRDSQTA